MSIEVKNITKFYGNQKALDNVSFEIKSGEIVGFLGPNGAGKSTMMKIITGFIEASDGDINVEGINVETDTLSAQKNMGYLPENNPLYKDMFVKEYLSFIAEIHKVSRKMVSPTIEKVGLLPEAHKKINQLSKGYQQRVGIAAAIIHDPKVLILDEPTTGLDPNQLIEIRSLIKEIGKNKIILFSTHILQEVEAVCDRVLVIKKGAIVADEKLSILKEQQAQIIEVAFDFQIEKRFFNDLPNVESVNNLHDTTWELTFSTKEDMRSLVFDFALKNGLKIVQLNSKNKNLESLFHELTQ
jgi:ABC-2 type transport system ATP-binding protein